MNLSAEEVTAFLDRRKHHISAIVEPAGVPSALAEIHKRLMGNLHRVRDMNSLESFVDVEAVDFALRPLYVEYCGDDPDEEMVEQLFAWRDRFLESEIRKTIRLHLRSKNASDVKGVMADVMGVMWERRKSFDREQGPFVPWARGIALNKARSHRPFVWREVSIDDDPVRPLDPPSPGPSPEESATTTADTEGPPAVWFVEILRLVQEFEPCEAIAFLFNRYLDMKPAMIARDIRELSLSHALAEAIKIVRTRYPEIAGIETVFAPLAGRIGGLTEKFGQYTRAGSTLEEDIGRWAEKIQRSVRGATLQMGKSFLRLVCGLTAAAHEIVCFLWIRFLYSPPVALRQVADRELMHLVETFHTMYSQRERLSLSQVEWCTSPLRKRLPQGCSLNNFAGSDLYASIRRWCEHVDSLIPSGAGELMLGYAYIMGFWKGKSR